MSSYKLHLFHVDGYVKTSKWKTKPTFKDMYKEIDCTMIERTTGYLPKYSNRKDGYTDLWMDEESKLKNSFIMNKNITDAWYKWAKKTGHQIIPGDFIAGHVCVIQKVQDDAA